MKLSIIMPTLNEAGRIAVALIALQPLRERGAEILVVDGGSTDGTVLIAAPGADHVVHAPRGRASQQNAGAKQALGDTFLFLHCDTQLPLDADGLIADTLNDSAVLWGRFDLRFDTDQTMLRVVATMMNARSRLTGIATGDQCLFVRRSAFEAVGGFPALSLMEDIALSTLLRRQSAPACLRNKVTTSARRWQNNGIWRTIFLMWWLRLAYALGVSPARLARWYGPL
jgi:rSAM/selenodomain-associated transferase 2